VQFSSGHCFGQIYRKLWNRELGDDKDIFIACSCKYLP